MKKFWIYILVSFGFGWLCQALAILAAAAAPAGLLYTALLAVCMFAPLLGTLAACGGLGKRAGIRWKPVLRGQMRWWLAAWFGPAVVTALGTALYFLLLPARFDGSLTTLNAAMAGTATALPAGLLLLIEVLQAVTYAPFINMLVAIGEEVGWRGWMTPFLCGRLGRKNGLVLSGVIWGAWHWPIIMLIGYNYGAGYWGAPFTGAAMMCLACVGLGIGLSFVYEKTDCIWAPALGHGAFNAIAGGLGLFLLAPDYAQSLILGPTPLGLIAGIPMLALGAFLLFRKAPEKS